MAARENTAVAPVATFRTGADGRFQVQLPTGTWCVVPAAATERPTEAPPGFDVEHLGCGGVPTCGPVELARP